MTIDKIIEFIDIQRKANVSNLAYKHTDLNAPIPQRMAREIVEYNEMINLLISLKPDEVKPIKE